VARKIAAREGINIEDVKGTGPAVRVTKQDILDKVKNGTKISQVSASLKITNLTKLRKTLAHNMEESQRIPAAAIYFFTTADELLKARRIINGKSAGKQIRSPMPQDS